MPSVATIAGIRALLLTVLPSFTRFVLASVQRERGLVFVPIPDLAPAPVTPPLAEFPGLTAMPVHESLIHAYIPSASRVIPLKFIPRRLPIWLQSAYRFASIA